MALCWHTILDTPKQSAPSRVRVTSEVAPTILSSTHAICDNGSVHVHEYVEHLHHTVRDCIVIVPWYQSFINCIMAPNHYVSIAESLFHNRKIYFHV